MSTASSSGLIVKDSSSLTPSISTSNTHPSESASLNASTTKSSPEHEKSKKTRIPPSPRTPPKLTSLGQKSSSFRMNTQPTPKSPRQFKEANQSKNDLEEKVRKLPSSSQSTSESTSSTSKPVTSFSTVSETQLGPLMSSSVPVLKIFKAQISSELLRKLESEHIDHVLVDLLTNDVCAQPIALDQRHAIGRTDAAFYVDRLPEVLQVFAKDSNQATISSSKLIQKVFAEEFRENTGWAEAKIFYANAMFKMKSQAGYAIGENDASVMDAEREKLKGLTEVIAKSIFGHPINLKNSALPRRLIDTLIYADQRFHDYLLTGKSTRSWTIEQINDARRSLIKLLTVTRLLMPMMSALAEKKPSQQEIWCLGLTMQVLLKSASQLSKEIFAESFAKSSSSLQKLATDKEKQERIQARTKALQTKTKKSGRHIRSRSADTQPVDIDWLARRDELQKKRAQEKKDVAIARTHKVLSELEGDTDAYAKVIDETSKAVKENEDIKKAESDLNTFSLEDLEQIQKFLDERDEQEIISLLPDGPVAPERARALPISTADPIQIITSEKSGLSEKN